MNPSTPPDDDDDGKAIDRLDAGEPPATSDEARRRIPYQRLIERIKDLAEIAPAPGWEERAGQRWRASRSGRWTSA